MFKAKKMYVGIVVACIFLIMTAIAGAAGQGLVSITFDLERIGGISSNQYAVWIEDSNGNYIKTLSATEFAAKKGFIKRTNTLPTWVKISNWLDSSETVVDSVSTATPGSGAVTVLWDGKDSQGQRVPAGTYVYKIEGNIFAANRVLWTGTIAIGKQSNSSVATAEYIPNKELATEKGLFISNVRSNYK